MKSLLFLAGVLGNTVPHGTGGIITAVGRKFFDNYKNVFLEKFIENIEETEWDSVSKVFPCPPHLMVNDTTSNFQISNVTFDASGTVFDIQSAEPQIRAELKDISFNFEFDYNITTDPWFVQDIGVGMVDVKNLTMKLAGSPKVEEIDGVKYHQITISHAEFSSDAFDIQLKGGDIAMLLSGFSDTFTDFVQTYIMTKFDSAMRDALEETINSNLHERDNFEQFPKYGIEIDYSLVDEGIHVSDNFISTILDGTIHKIGEDEASITKEFQSMPLYDVSGREVQILISEYSVNTILRSLIELDYIEYERVLSSDEITSIIEDFEEPFGNHGEVKMIIKATPINGLHPNYHPKAIINKKESIYSFSVDIHIMNPFDDTVDAMVLQMQLKSYISYNINNDFQIIAEAREIEAEFTKIDAYFKSRTTKTNLNDRL